jgi:hypothetical protein
MVHLVSLVPLDHIERVALNRNEQQRTAALYVETFPTLLQNASIPELSPEDSYSIVAGIERSLPTYKGRLTSASFRKWALGIIIPAAQLTALRRQYDQHLLKGVRSITYACWDLGADEYVERDIVDDCWVKIYLKLPAWLEKGTAKMTTRMYAMGRINARSWKKTQVRSKDKHVFIDHVADQRRERAQEAQAKSA